MEANWTLIGQGLQAIGLGLAAARDVTKKNAETAYDAIRETQLVEVFEAAKTGTQYEESTQEKNAKLYAVFAAKFDWLLPYSIGLAAIGTLLQIFAEWSK